jgi:tetratricopeptide (TPR) repeat protein
MFLCMASHTMVYTQTTDSISFYMQQYEFENLISYIDLHYPKFQAETERMKAKAYVSLKKYKEAALSYEKLYSYDSSDIHTMVELANCYQLLGNYPQSIVYLQKALQQRPLNSYLQIQIADVYYKSNAYYQAIEHYMRACLHDTSFYVSKQLALCYDKLDRIDTAMYYYDKTIGLNPSDFYSTHRLASIHLQNKAYEKALHLTSSYLQVDSTHTKALEFQAYIHYLNKTYRDALRSFEKCLALYDTSDFTKRYLGYCYYETQQYQEAKSYLEQAFQNDTNNLILCYTLGLACHQASFGQLAVYYLERTLTLSNPTPEFLSRLYQDLAAAQTGIYKRQQALDSYLKAYELTPNDKLLLFKIATQYDKFLENKTMALQYYQTFMQTRADSVNATPTITDAYGYKVSYYDVAKRRIHELKEELFMQGKNTNHNKR